VSIVGIDLGTTHCAIAWVDASEGPGAKVVDFPIPQLVRPGEVMARALLPSCIYLASEHELPEQSLCLPWPDSTRTIVGELARWRGAQVPGRLVSSAKSWLCHSGVDRSEAILPWAASDDVVKLSPVDASARLLSHLTSAWGHAHPNAPLSESEVVITVPASFDEVARSLTVSAARKAGLEKFTLLEEPQAAFYDFSAHHRDDLAEALRGVRLVLVVDVGGGTTDLTLIQVASSPQGPALRRIAVGDHLMLGGDNMDAALAHRIEQRLSLGGRRLGIREWNPLLQSSRVAKESLLGADAPEQYHFSIATEGSQLLKGSRSIELTRTEAEQVVLDGFFPLVGPGEVPQRRDRMALQ